MIEAVNVDLSKSIANSGDTVQLSATILGGIAPYTYDIQFTDRTGVIQDTGKMTIKSKKSDSGAEAYPIVKTIRDEN